MVPVRGGGNETIASKVRHFKKDKREKESLKINFTSIATN